MRRYTLTGCILIYNDLVRYAIEQAFSDELLAQRVCPVGNVAQPHSGANSACAVVVEVPEMLNTTLEVVTPLRVILAVHVLNNVLGEVAIDIVVEHH